MAGHPEPLAAQVVVVTGASSGIGLATARRAAERGARVVLVSRDATGLAREIEAAGGQALAAPADVGVEAAVAGVVDAAVARFGRIDTWVNNAGVAAYSTPCRSPSTAASSKPTTGAPCTARSPRSGISAPARGAAP